MNSDTVSNRKAAAILAAMAVVTGLVAYFCLRPVQPQALPPLTLKDPPSTSNASSDSHSGSRSTPSSAGTAEEDGPPSEAGIKVHVTGAVLHPGVYSLPSGSRVQDAIAAAGGAAPQGDANALNQAELLEDGGKIVVPAIGSASVPSQQAKDPPVAADPADWRGPDKGHVIVRQAPGTNPSMNTGTPGAPAPGYNAGISGTQLPQNQNAGDGGGAINLNTASQAQLMQVGRIGAVTATKIITYREEHGGFRSVEELRNIRGIGAKTYEQIAPFFTVN